MTDTYTEREMDILIGLEALAEEAYQNAKNHGFHDGVVAMREIITAADPSLLEEFETLIGLGRLMLIVTELAEAAEALRKGDTDNFAEEIADVQIRLGDEGRARHVSLGAAVVAKMAVNRSRPHKHGKRA